MGLKVLTLNVNGLNHPAKRNCMWKEGQKHDTNLLYIQGLHYDVKSFPHCSHKSYPHIFLASTSAKKRVILSMRNSAFFSLKESILDPEGRYIILLCQINSNLYTLVNVYVPNVHQIRFLKRLFKKLKSVQHGSLIMGSDFNTVNDSTLETSPQVKDCAHNLLIFSTHKMFIMCGDATTVLKETMRSYLPKRSLFGS